MKAITVLAIEKTLCGIGEPVFDKVAKKLQKEHDCYIPDCYDHPEYLDKVLRSIFGNSYLTIVKSIKEELMENIDDVGIRTLVKTIGG